MSSPRVAWLCQTAGSGARQQAELVADRTEATVELVAANTLDIEEAKYTSVPGEVVYPTESIEDVLTTLAVDAVVIHSYTPALGDELDAITESWPTAVRVGMNFHEMFHNGLGQLAPPVIEMLQQADHLVAPSEATKAELACVAPGVVTEVIPSVLPVENSNEPPADAENIPDSIGLLSARIEPHKGQYLIPFIVAAIDQKRDGEPPTAIVTGEMNQRVEKIRDTAAALNVAEHVKFVGYVDDVWADFWPRIGVYAHPSLSERSSVSVAEAAFAGVPSILPQTAWGQENTAGLALRDDPMGWASSIDALLSSPQMHREEVRHQQSEMLEWHDADRWIPVYDALFEQLASEKT